MPLDVFTATRYVQPLREGGSLPAIVDTDGGGLFVVKFRGAGQGAKVLIAEIIVAGLARAAGLPVPEVALVEILAPFGKSEPDSEIQGILKGSHGLNVGLRYLDGAFNFDANAAGNLISPELAARIVWLDAFVTNPDRSHRNPNMLVWDHRVWLIDHGAALYAQHDWASVNEHRTRAPFPLIEQHVLLACAGDLDEADHTMTAALTESALRSVVADVPDELLLDPISGRDFADAASARARYVEYLTVRLEAPRAFVAGASAAAAKARVAPPRRLSARR